MKMPLPKEWEEKIRKKDMEKLRQYADKLAEETEICLNSYKMLDEILANTYDHTFPPNFPESEKVKFEGGLRLLDFMVRAKKRIGVEAEEKYKECSIERKHKWIEENWPVISKILDSDNSPPMKAYRIYMQEQLGYKGEREKRYIHFTEVSDAKIAWKCNNPCYVLESCLALGLDPEEICEKFTGITSFQPVFDLIDPRLTFYRPHIRKKSIRGDDDEVFCKEVIELKE